MPAPTYSLKKFPKLRQRHQAVKWALAMTRGTSLEPSPYERFLLTRYARGFVTIDQVLERLANHGGHSSNF
jgi:hypothetical protein